MSQGSNTFDGIVQRIANNLADIFQSPRCGGGHSRNPSDVTEVLLNAELQAPTEVNRMKDLGQASGSS